MNRKTRIALLAVIMLIVLGIFSACGKRTDAIEKEFTDLVSAEKVTPENLAETAEYMTKYLHKLNREKGSRMLVAFEEFAAKYMNTDADQTQVQKLGTYFDKDTGAMDKEKLKKEEASKNYYELLGNSYIHVGYSADQVTLDVDYEALFDEFHRSVLPAVAELYEFKAEIQRHPATENATLKISYGELLSRALTLEELIRDNKEEELIADDVKWLYNTYMNMILMGTTNTPVFDYQTGEFSARAKEADKTFRKENSGTVTAWALGEYFKYLEEMDYQLNYKEDVEKSKAFFDACARITSEAEKRVYQ